MTVVVKLDLFSGPLTLDRYTHLMTEEGIGFRDAIVQGSMERLSPILMTALVTGIGLLPLALGAGEPGKEIQHPMAVVILGGIVTSTFLIFRSTCQLNSSCE
ncbi:MAG TPA: efflux RND transporter permease subunit [Blastocatellia bacterium]|nr:efflux RND transporter permease subunit [Blastocatellia bacterium]